jgi:hypothetical protein
MTNSTKKPANRLAGRVSGNNAAGGTPPAGSGGDDYRAIKEVIDTILSLLPKRATPMIMGEGRTETYKGTRFAQIIREVADEAGLPKSFTLDACRHGGMTELEEAGLTEGQGRALSAHRSRAYERYAKRTAKRMLGATKARHQHRAGGTE